MYEKRSTLIIQVNGKKKELARQMKNCHQVRSNLVGEINSYCVGIMLRVSCGTRIIIPNNEGGAEQFKHVNAV